MNKNKAIIFTAVIVTLLPICKIYCQEINHWSRINELSREAESLDKKVMDIASKEGRNVTAEDFSESKAIWDKMTKYVESLNGSELLLAAHQGCIAANNLPHLKEVWECEAAGVSAVHFCLKYYLKKVEDIDDVTPLIDGIKGKEKNEAYRVGLISWWQEQTNSRQSNKFLHNHLQQSKDETFNMFFSIIRDKTDSARVRKAAMEGMRDLLLNSYNRTLMKDNNVIASRNENKKNFDINNSVKSGKLILEEPTTVTLDNLEMKIMNFVDASSDILLNENVFENFHNSIRRSLKIFSSLPLKDFNKNRIKTIVKSYESKSK